MLNNRHKMRAGGLGATVLATGAKLCLLARKYGRELVCQAGLYQSHGSGIDARFALWTLLGTVSAMWSFWSSLTWPPEKPTATMPKSVPFLRNLGWRVGASMIGEYELLAEEWRKPLLSSQYTSLAISV